MSSLLLIDGHYHLFRFYHGIPLAAKLSDGTTVNAIYGFVAMLRRLLAQYEDCSLLVVFDSEDGTAEKILQKPEYKQGRKDTEDSLFEQLDILKALLDDTGIKWLEVPQHEGDDVLCSLSHVYYERYEHIFIVSNDKDFFQLVDDKVHLIKENNGKQTIIDPAWIQDRFQINPHQYPLFLALVGDKSDNIEGLPGVGPGWCKKIIGDHRNINGLLDVPEAVPQRFRSLLQDNREFIIKTMDFLSMKGNIPIPKKILESNLNSINKELLQNTIALLKRNGFGE